MQGDSIHLPSMARVDQIQTIALVTNQGLWLLSIQNEGLAIKAR